MDQNEMVTGKVSVFNGSLPWYVYKVQFEAATRFNGWMCTGQAANLMLPLQGQAIGLLR